MARRFKLETGQMAINTYSSLIILYLTTSRSDFPVLDAQYTLLVNNNFYFHPNPFGSLESILNAALVICLVIISLT